MNRVISFIEEYGSENKSEIQFNWNGSNKEWADLNEEFRSKVCEKLLSSEIKGSNELLRDIFLAEADFCREAWGATQNVRDLGTLLLVQSLDLYVKEFFEGKSQSFDTDNTVSASEVPIDILKTIIERLKKTAKISTDLNMDYYIGYFEGCLNR